MTSHKLIRFILPPLTLGALALTAWTFADRATPVATAADPHAGHDHGTAAGKAPDDHAEPADSGHGADEGDAHAGHDHGVAANVPEGDCAEHGIPEAEDALCQPQLIAGLRPGQGLKVRLAATDAAERIGIAADRPTATADRGAALPGQATFNRDRLARLSAPLAGVVKRIHVELGQHVQAGQVLAEIAAPEIAGLRAALQTAESRATLGEATHRRETELFARGISSRQEVQQAEAERAQAQSAAAQARRQLADYGVAGATLPLRAPFAGTVLERSAVLGEAVAPGVPLFAVADLSRLWIELSAPESRLLELRPGAALDATFAGLPGRSFAGKIFWVAPALDEKTRMLKALAELDNPDGLLKSGQFGEVRLAGEPSGEVLTVPADALQTIDGATHVFVALERDLFELRRVEAGGRTNGAVAILAGLTPEDQVVGGQGFALKSEILKSKLGASCADH